jgi:hypothetical protein
MSSQVGKGDMIYRPKNVKKYIGNPPHCIIRSSWELIFCKWADNNPAIVEWASEPLPIPYIDKMQRDSNGMPKKRRYFPDFIVKILNKEGKIDTWIVEIKPYKETIPPKPGRTKSQQTKLYEAKTWATNTAKWRAAEEFCRRRGWLFRILTEKQLLQGK